MNFRGREDRAALVVALTDRGIETWEQLWDALVEPCGLPGWFGRNLNAWWDTIQGGGILETLDDCAELVVRLRSCGFFGDNGDGKEFIEVTNKLRSRPSRHGVERVE